MHYVIPNVQGLKTTRTRRRERDPRGKKLLFQVAQLHYERGQSKTAIADSLGVSVTQVVRLIREASAQGIVRITVSAPRHVALEEALGSTFGLRDVRVIAHSPDDGGLRTHLGREAARLFLELVRPRMKVGLGSGRTMYELVAALPQRPMPIEILPLALIVDQSLDVRSIDAMTLVTTLWFKFRPDAKALRMGLTFPGASLEKVRSLRDELLGPVLTRHLYNNFANTDILFFSASQPRQDSQIVDVTRTLGIGVPELKERGAVGDFLFRPVDGKGHEVDVGLEPFVLGIPLTLLRDVASANKKPVVLVAGGRDKLPVIRAGLEARYFNTLITDDDTASALLDDANGRREGGERESEPSCSIGGS